MWKFYRKSWDIKIVIEKVHNIRKWESMPWLHAEVFTQYHYLTLKQQLGHHPVIQRHREVMRRHPHWHVSLPPLHQQQAPRMSSSCAVPRAASRTPRCSAPASPSAAHVASASWCEPARRESGTTRTRSGRTRNAVSRPQTYFSRTTQTFAAAHIFQYEF